MSTPARRPPPPTRPQLQRALAVNAATKPVNVAVPAAVAVAGIVLGAVWLIALAVVVYVALGLLTFFDGAEAERVGQRAYARGKGAPAPKGVDAGALAPPIRRRVEAARREQGSIARTLQQSDLDWTDVGPEVAGLLRALEAAAGRAQRLYGYLATQDLPDLERRLGQARGEARDALRTQRQVLLHLHGRLDDVTAEMDAVLASLETVHARLIGASVAREGASEADVVGTVRELRARVDAVTDGLEAAYPAA